MASESAWIDADELARILGRRAAGAPLLTFTEAAQLAAGRPYQHHSDGTTMILVDKATFASARPCVCNNR
jgi:hypothetical protein